MEVHTNPAVFKDGALRVSPCQADHACELICPDNMCKGKVSFAICHVLAIACDNLNTKGQLGAERPMLCVGSVL